MGLSSWNPRVRYYLMATENFSMLFQGWGDSSGKKATEAKQTKPNQQSTVACVCNASTGGAETGGSLGLTDNQPSAIVKCQASENLP